MVQVLDALAKNPDGDLQVEMAVREKVAELTSKFPIYPS